MNLGIVILYVHDLQKAKAFYSDVIGLPVDVQQTDAQFVMLRPTEGSLLALEDISISQANPQTHAGCCEIGFHMHDVDAIWSRWKAKGVEMVTEVEDKPFGRTFTAKDPEGHFLTVYG
jgi:predicted enzyme related to lactoylglutathione lyase